MEKINTIFQIFSNTSSGFSLQYLIFSPMNALIIWNCFWKLMLLNYLFPLVKKCFVQHFSKSLSLGTIVLFKEHQKCSWTIFDWSGCWFYDCSFCSQDVKFASHWFLKLSFHLSWKVHDELLHILTLIWTSKPLIWRTYTHESKKGYTPEFCT